MSSVKVVVTGPFGAGKTTMITTISEVAVLSTERDISDHTRIHKDQTTVAMDFGRISIDRNLVLYLFGTPGQERFDFMWEILAEGMLGFILVVDSVGEAACEEAKAILDAFRTYGSSPFVVALNRYQSTDLAGEIARVRTRLQIKDEVPVIPMNALDRGEVKNVLLALLYLVLESYDQELATAQSA